MPARKLTKDQIYLIYSQYKDKGAAVLARELKVSRQSVNNVLNQLRKRDLIIPKRKSVYDEVADMIKKERKKRA